MMPKRQQRSTSVARKMPVNPNVSIPLLNKSPRLLGALSVPFLVHVSVVVGCLGGQTTPNLNNMWFLDPRKLCSHTEFVITLFPAFP